MTLPALSPTSTILAGKQDLSRGFAHFEDYPIELGDVFTRYIGLGSRLDLLTPASVINRLVKKYFGDSYDVIPRSKEHAKNAATINRSFLDWLSWQRGAAARSLHS